jgi:hypothetical protein
VLYFAGAFLIGLLIVPERRLLFSKWFAAGALVAVAIALPNFIWQAVHGFPMLEVLRAGQNGKNVILSPLQWLFAELLIVGPVLSLVVIAGVVWTFLQPRFRFLGFGFLILIAAMIASHAKHYYPADVYPIFFAAGGAAVEAWTQSVRYLRPVAVALAAIGGLFFLPYVEPILPEDSFIAFNKAIGPKLGLGVTVTEHQKQSWMTQDWADMHGWPQLARTVQRVADALPPADRANAVVFAQNYGEASAVAFFTPLPVVSGHNQYFLWGTHGSDLDVMIDIGGQCWHDYHLYRSVRKAATFTDAYAMPYESDLPIYICRGITRPIADLWPKAKHFE